MAQSIIYYLAALFLGLELTVNTLRRAGRHTHGGVLIALALMWQLFNDKQVGGICGALLTNLAAWLSGTWFDLELVGGVFKQIAYGLPFVHGVELQRAALRGEFGGVFPHLWWVLGYACLSVVVSILVFTRKMRKN